MIKKSITEPKFGRIFAVRFLISLVVFAILASYALYRLDDYVWQNVDKQREEILKRIVEVTKTMSKEDPDSEQYKKDLDVLKCKIALYQNFDHSYVEVTIKDKHITVGDTASFSIVDAKPDPNNPKEAIVKEDIFFIENMSYLDPVNGYMNGMFDERKQNEMYDKWARDPLFDNAEHVGKFDYFRAHRLMTVYVNRETRTFLPGMVKVVYMNREYLIDCTPADTKGYEMIDFSKEPNYSDGTYIWLNYRTSPELTSADFLYVIVPDSELDTNEIEPNEYLDKLSKGLMSDYGWYIGYTQPYYPYPPVFMLAPVSSAIIIAAAIVLAAVTAFVFAIVRYQKDKTVWKIFEYRVETTEAMAHDLKTPLSTMMFYLDNLEESSEDPEKVREYAKTLNDKVVTMDHAIADILQFSKGESSKAKLNKEEVNVKEIVTEALKEFPEMNAEIKGGDVTLMTDKKVLSQVILNLLSNCDRYGRKDSFVDIAIDTDALMITNKTDRKYDDVDSLKKPFVKGDDHRGSKGTGLGLAIADNDLSLLGYKLELSSGSDEFKVKVKFKS